MQYCPLLLILLCHSTHGKLHESPARRLQHYAAAACQDGTDCTSDKCKAVAQEEASKEVCENVIENGAASLTVATKVATNPQGKTPGIMETRPFCVKFNDPADTDGFDKCPGIYDNIDLNNFGTDDPVNPLTMDNILHLTDRSGGSLACGTGNDYTGDWTALSKSTCNELCFDVKLFYDGCHSGVPGCNLNASNNGYYLEIFPSIILQGGPPTFFRAVFKAFNFMTDKDGSSSEWRTICAPLAPLNSTGNLPSNEFGYWYMATPNDVISGGPSISGPPSPDSAWPALLADVTAIQLPVDFTSNPAERIGYDNICIKEKDCKDHCDPEPLCYWRYEWSCERAKREEWYLKFTNLISPLRTFSDKFCLCKILKQQCPDLCSIAEQEFAALLLNIASSKLSPDCCIKECDNCVHNTRSIVSLIDNLLAPSSRSDYDCSKALQFLTGINQDEILCDTCTCPQVDACLEKNGSCVPRNLCIPSSTVKCIDFLCAQGGLRDCICRIVDIGTASPVTDKPSTNPDIKNPTISPMTDKPITNPDTRSPTRSPTTNEPTTNPVTNIPSGNPATNMPTMNPVTKIPTGNPTTNKPTMNPVTQIPTQIPTTDKPVLIGTASPVTRSPVGCNMIDIKCDFEKGACVKNCIPSEVTQCIKEWCDLEDGTDDACYCKINQCDQTTECAQKNGICIGPGDCDPLTEKCDSDLCKDPCVCKITDNIGCTMIDNECELAKGACVKDCQPTEVTKCVKEWCNVEAGTDDACSCKIEQCVQTRDCAKRNGFCVGFFECDPLVEKCGYGLCGDDQCVCKKNVFIASSVKVDQRSGQNIAMMEVQVLSSGKNVATGKSSTQSSTFKNFGANLAVDGKSDTFSHTNVTSGDSTAWWQVELGDALPVDSVTVINRPCGGSHDPNGCFCRLSQATLLLLDKTGVIVATQSFGDTCGKKEIVLDDFYLPG